MRTQTQGYAVEQKPDQLVDFYIAALSDCIASTRPTW